MKSHSDQENEITQLLRMAKTRLPLLKKLLADVSSHWGYEDLIYRFYHQSFKVYGIQSQTQKIVTELRALAPHLQLNACFEKIVSEGTEKEFDTTHNQNWLIHTRPMIEAFFHAKYMLEMACKYAEELNEAPQLMPSGWASVLYLYNLR